jgi:hypothetical protein
MRLLTRITATLLLLAVCCTAYPQQSYLRYHDLMDLRASAQAVPNMTVKVASGIADITGLQVTYAGGNSPTFTAPGATNRIDLLTIDSAGTLAITEGAAAASPTPPAYPAWKLPICEVYLKSTSTSIVSYNDGASAHGYIYADVRPVLQMAMVNPTTHALLSLTHSDTTAAAAAVGAIITGQTGPVWARLTIGSAGKILRSDGTNLVYTTATYPTTTTASQLLYSNGANAIEGLATGNSSVLVTNGSGVPSLATDIPTAVTIGTKYIYRAGGTDVAVADGGTNLSTVAAGSILAANALNTLTAITSTSDTKVLQNAAGTISWASTAAPGAHNLLSASHGDTAVGTVLRGDLVTGQTASPAWTRLALGTVGKVLRSDGTDVAWSAVTLPASTTSGRVLYSTGTSALGDDADLTFDGTALSATNLIVTGATAASKAMIQRSTTQYLDLYGTSTANYIVGVSAVGNPKPLYIENNQAANCISFNIGGVGQVEVWDGIFRPATDNDVTLGASSLFWSKLYAYRHYLNATAYLDGANAGRIGVSGTIDAFSMTAANSLTFSAGNIVTDTTTGTKIGTGATQKLGFFNATPVVQPTGDVATALSALGLVASPTIAGGTGSFLGMYVHTSGTTHTTGATCHTIIVELIGGGGGGGGAKGATGPPLNSGAGGGGGSGSYARKTFTVAPSTGYTYAVGAAGAAGSTAPGDGGAGGNTTFAVGATTVTAFGGSGGVAGPAGTLVVSYSGGAGGVVATNGDVNTTGQPGGWGLRCSGTYAASGTGGASTFGGGGIGEMGDGAGQAGGGYGSGGSGAAAGSTTGVAGGAGAAGVVIVWEFN